MNTTPFWSLDDETDLKVHPSSLSETWYLPDTTTLFPGVDHCNNTSEGTVQGDKGRAPKGFIVSRNIIHT
jgi:hypothetical protein